MSIVRKFRIEQFFTRGQQEFQKDLLPLSFVMSRDLFSWLFFTFCNMCLKIFLKNPLTNDFLLSKMNKAGESRFIFLNILENVFADLETLRHAAVRAARKH